MNKKPFLAVLIVIFVMALTFFIRISGTDNSELSELNNQDNNPESSQSNNPEDNPPILPGTILSAEFVTHNSESDCWVIYKNKVYDVTSWLPNHPGGADKISPHCGTGGFEQAFTQKHGTSKANLLMQVGTFIGDFDVVGSA